MNTTRTVTPQWAGADSKNLGERELATKELTFARIAAETNPKVQAAITDLINGQLSIRMGPFITAQFAPEKLADEKHPAYMERTHAAMKHMFEQFEGPVDFEDLLASIAEKAGAKRGGDPMVKFLRERWERNSPEKRAGFLKVHPLAGITTASTTEQVIAAWELAVSLD